MMHIRSFYEADYPQFATIYSDGIATGIATFQMEVPSWQDWDNSHLIHCRIAAFEDELMAGWAALSPVSTRTVYAGVAEVSVYIATQFRGRGVGELLMNKLIAESEKEGIWTLQSSVFAENHTSIKLHEKVGFRQVGYREKIGKRDGVWKDTILMERRSAID